MIGWAFFVGLPLLIVLSMLLLGQDIFAPGTFGLPAWALLLIGGAYMLCFVPLIQTLNVSGMRRRNPSVGGVQTYTINHEGYSVQGSFFRHAGARGKGKKAESENGFHLGFSNSLCSLICARNERLGIPITTRHPLFLPLGCFCSA